MLDRLFDAFVVAAGGCSTTSSVVVVVVLDVDCVQRDELLVRRLLQRCRSHAAQRCRLSHLQRLQLVVQVSESVKTMVRCTCSCRRCQSSFGSARMFNALMGIGTHSATSNNMKLVHWTLMGGLLHLYREEGTGQGRSPPRPIFAVANVTVHPSTASVLITVLLYNGPLLCGFNVGLTPIQRLKSATRRHYACNLKISSVWFRHKLNKTEFMVLQLKGASQNLREEPYPSMHWFVMHLGRILPSSVVRQFFSVNKQCTTFSPRFSYIR